MKNVTMRKEYLAVFMAIAMVFAGAVFITEEVNAEVTDAVDLGEFMTGFEPVDGVLTVELEADTEYKFAVTGIAATSDTGGTKYDAGKVTVTKGTEKVLFIGKGETSIITTAGQVVNAGGLDIEMNNLTFKAGNANYVGFHHVGDEVYTDCWIVGKLQTYTEGILDISGCTFTQNDSNNYNIQIYGSPTEANITDSTFNCAGKSFHIYSEWRDKDAVVLIKDCTFISTSDEYKAAIQVHSQYRHQVVTIEDCTATGFAKGDKTGSILWDYRVNTDVNNSDGYGDSVPQVMIVTSNIEDVDGMISSAPEEMASATFDSDKGVSKYYYDITTALLEPEILLVNDLVYDGELTLTGKIIVPEGISITATIVTDDGNSATLEGVKAGANGFTISKGSLIITGNIVENAGSSIVIESGDEVYLSGTIDVPIVVEEGATLLVEEGKSLEAPSIEGDGAIVNNGTIVAEIDSSLETTGNGQVDVTAPMETVTLSGVLESDVVGKANQIITVTDDLVVKDGVSITINGKFIVEADAEVTFESGSAIVFGMGSEATIDGDIIIEGAETGKTTFSFSGYKMAVNGSVTLDGANAFACTGAVEIAGYFEVSDVASAAFTNGATVLAGGELMIYGVAAGDIVNNGTVTIDSEGILDAAGTGIDNYIGKDEVNFNVEMGADAVIDVVNIYGHIHVCDCALKFKTGGNYVDVENDNEITITNVKGVKVTESLIIKNDDNGDRIGVNTMTISGSVSAADNAIAGITVADFLIEAGSENVAISDAFVIGEAEVTVDGKLLVFANVDATADGAVIDGAGAITVTGKITAKAQIVGPVLNATMYTTVSPAYYIYTTFEAALAAGATDITVTGEVEIASDITIPVGTKVDVANATNVTIADDATVTVEAEDKKSGVLKNDIDTPIDVEGTLVIENLAKSGVNKNKVVSDTSKATADNVGMTYTNIYNALADAVEGDEVEITAATVTLDKDLTVPAGVTLLVPEDCTLYAGNDITVTIDGTMDIAGTYIVSAAVDDGKIAKTVVAGMVLMDSMDSIIILGDEPIVGAFFGYDGGYSIAPLTVVAGMVDDVEGGSILLSGDMVVGDIAFDYTGDEDITLIAVSDLDAGEITLGGIRFAAIPGSNVSATIVLTNGSIILDNIDSVVISDEVTYDIDNNEVYTATIDGDASADDGDANTTDDKGTIGIVGAVSSTMNTASGVTVNVPADATLTITAGTIDAIVIEGTVEIDATTTVGIGTATVIGTIDGDAVSIDAIYAGIAKDDITATTAANAVIGDKVVITSTGVAYVAPGTTVGKGITEAVGIKTTEYYVENGLYLTAYAGASTAAKIGDIVAKIDNAEFNGWLDADGEDVVVGALVGSTGYDKVYASVDYKIFTLSVNTIPGAIVYIDGVEYVTGTEYAAGVHTIEVYLKAGYEGTPVINVNGTTVTDSFTISGEETVITVSGVTAATGSGTIVIEDKDDGMALTDILLIVLVVLIVIMAIIVALRMMRS